VAGRCNRSFAECRIEGPLSLWERVRVRAGGEEMACLADANTSPPTPLPKGERTDLQSPRCKKGKRGKRGKRKNE
jgi:hypothetical protein